MITLRKIKLFIPFTVLFLMFALLWSELSSTRSFAYSSGISGDKLPSFNVPSLFGSGRVNNSDLSGKVAMLNFWASWCSACRAEHPMLMKIKKNYGIPIYGIAFKDEPREAKEFLDQRGNPYTAVGNDESGTTGVDFGIYGTPETYVVNKKGDIIYKQIGVIDQRTWDEEIYPVIKRNM